MLALIEVSLKVSSDPPAIMTLATPSWILLMESPMALSPVAQAVEAVELGPFSLYLIVTLAVGMLLRTCNMVNRLMVWNDFLVSRMFVN